jgi:ankyrin repeat protein
MPIISFSSTVDTILRAHAKTMTQWDIDRIIQRIPKDANPLFYVLQESSSLSPFEAPYFNARAQVIHALLHKNPQLLQSRTPMGDTPLDMAKALGDTKIINLLIEQSKSLRKSHP